MEMGTLADWVTGIATLMAVLTSLFLAYFDGMLKRRRDKVKSKNYIKYSASRLFLQIQNYNKDENTSIDKIRKSPEYIMLNTWILINLMLEKSYMTDIVTIAQQLKDLVDHYPETEHFEEQYKKLIKYIDEV